MSDILKAFLENEAAIKRFLKRYCSVSQTVEDYAQETFLKGFAAETRTTIAEPKAFLFKIAKNVALAESRKNSRSANGHLQEVEDVSQILDEEQSTQDEWLDGRKKLIQFSKAVAHLTPQCRRAFLMRRIDGLQYKQIANRMGISVSAVEKHVANGLLKCNRHLRAKGYEPSEFGAALKVAQKLPPNKVQQMVKQDE